VLLQLIYQIQQAMYFGDRNQPKVVLIDEGWDLLMEGEVSHFIEHGYRRFRKYQGSAITILHSLNDLYDKAVGRAIADTSAHTLMLAQPSQSVDQLLAAKRLPMNEGGAQLLKSVHTIPGEYSEIMLLTDAGAGIGRLIVDPFTRLLYSTNPVEVAQIQRLRERGMSYAQAIRALLGVYANAA
jgi:conjugal transfer ATP-binding protein TraC